MAAAQLGAMLLVSSLSVQEPKITGLCSVIFDRTRMTEQDTSVPLRNGYRYFYEKIILTASGISPENATDSAEFHKISQFWRSNYYRLMKCESNTFDIRRGSVAKYAIAAGFDSFVNRMAQWGVELNFIDENRMSGTILDYVVSHMSANQTNTSLINLERYYHTFRSAGAKYSCELAKMPNIPQPSDSPQSRAAYRAEVAELADAQRARVRLGFPESVPAPVQAELRAACG